MKKKKTQYAVFHLWKQFDFRLDMEHCVSDGVPEFHKLKRWDFFDRVDKYKLVVHRFDSLLDAKKAADTVDFYPEEYILRGVFPIDEGPYWYHHTFCDGAVRHGDPIYISKTIKRVVQVKGDELPEALSVLNKEITRKSNYHKSQKEYKNKYLFKPD